MQRVLVTLGEEVRFYFEIIIAAWVSVSLLAVLAAPQLRKRDNFVEFAIAFWTGLTMIYASLLELETWRYYHGTKFVYAGSWPTMAISGVMLAILAVWPYMHEHWTRRRRHEHAVMAEVIQLDSYRRPPS